MQKNVLKIKNANCADFSTHVQWENDANQYKYFWTVSFYGKVGAVDDWIKKKKYTKYIV